MEQLQKNLDQIINSFEKNIIEKTLKDTHGNQSKAAKLLGISKRKIQYKIKKYNIDFILIKRQNPDTSDNLTKWYNLSSEKNQTTSPNIGHFLLP